jgi:hypothetical protein
MACRPAIWLRSLNHLQCTALACQCDEARPQRVMVSSAPAVPGRSDARRVGIGRSPHHLGIGGGLVDEDKPGARLRQATGRAVPTGSWRHTEALVAAMAALGSGVWARRLFSPEPGFSGLCAAIAQNARVCKMRGAASLHAVRGAFKCLPDPLRRYRPRLTLHRPLEPENRAFSILSHRPCLTLQPLQSADLFRCCLLGAGGFGRDMSAFFETGRCPTWVVLARRTMERTRIKAGARTAFPTGV